MWASVTLMPSRQTNPRTERKMFQRLQFSEFARNGTRELIRICSNRMASKCENAWHACQHDKSIRVPSDSPVNAVSSPSSLGIDPLRSLSLSPETEAEWKINRCVNCNPLKWERLLLHALTYLEGEQRPNHPDCIKHLSIHRPMTQWESCAHSTRLLH
jgi:hypothetical protein